MIFVATSSDDFQLNPFHVHKILDLHPSLTLTSFARGWEGHKGWKVTAACPKEANKSQPKEFPEISRGDGFCWRDLFDSCVSGVPIKLLCMMAASEISSCTSPFSSNLRPPKIVWLKAAKSWSHREMPYHPFFPNSSLHCHTLSDTGINSAPSACHQKLSYRLSTFDPCPTSVRVWKFYIHSWG